MSSACWILASHFITNWLLQRIVSQTRWLNLATIFARPQRLGYQRCPKYIWLYLMNILSEVNKVTRENCICPSYEALDATPLVGKVWKMLCWSITPGWSMGVLFIKENYERLPIEMKPPTLHQKRTRRIAKKSSSNTILYNVHTTLLRNPIKFKNCSKRRTKITYIFYTKPSNLIIY